MDFLPSPVNADGLLTACHYPQNTAPAAAQKATTGTEFLTGNYYYERLLQQL